MPVAARPDASAKEAFSLAVALSVLMGLMVAGWAVLVMLLIYLIIDRG